jgi:general stress protein 26
MAISHDQQSLVLDILGQALDLTVATNRPDGWPQATTVSFVSDGLTLYFGTWSQSQTSENIARDPRVSVAVNAPYRAWETIRSLSLAGEATIVTAREEMAKVGMLMMERFGSELAKQGSIDMSQTTLIRITPRIISLLDYGEGFGHKAEIVLSAITAAN